MQNTREVYLVELDAFKNEAKNIKKSNKHIQTYSHTKTLNTLAVCLGFKNYNEYENYLNHRDTIESKSISSLTMDELIDLRHNIKESFNQIGFSLDKIYFIEYIYNKKVETMKSYSPYSIGLYLYTLPYILGRPELNCINISTSEIDENKTYELLKLVYEKYTNEKSDILKIFKSFKNNQILNNMFDVYHIFMNSNPEYIDRALQSSFINKDFNHPSDISYNYREFYFALDDRNKKYKRKESLVFEWMMSIDNKEMLSNLINNIKDELHKEIIFTNQFPFVIKKDLDKKLRVPNFDKSEHYNDNFSEIVSNIKNNTDFENPFLLGSIIKKTGLLSSIFKKEEYLPLSQREASEHILITGSAGSGKTALLYSYAVQSMMNNKGFIFVSFGNPSCILTLNKLAEKFNVADKLITLSVNHDKEIKNIDVNELINNNNIVIITAPFHHEEKLNESNLTKVNIFLSKINTHFKGYFPFSIFFDNIIKLDNDAYNLFTTNLKKFRKNNCKVFICINNLSCLYKEREKVLNYFKNIIILKLEDQEDFCVYKKLTNQDLNFLDLKNQNAMSFHYINTENYTRNNRVKGFFLLPFLSYEKSFTFSNSNIQYPI